MTHQHPLAATVARADAERDWLAIRIADEVPSGWTRCSEVDADHVARWEERVEAWHRAELGRTHPRATSGYVLGYYAEVAPAIAASFFRLDRRVPTLTAEALAFRTDPVHTYVDGIALLRRTFWCLPGDAAAAHPDATVVADEAALAMLLRQQVRAHADAFLATYRPRARLPRRALAGAFYDALDAGLASEQGEPPGEPVPVAARLVLPGPTAEFAQGTSYYRTAGPAPGGHLTRRRVSCCYYYQVGDDGACTTCPRTSDEERARRLSAEAAS